MSRPVFPPAAVDYPSSDGKPVAESDFQFTPLRYAVDALRAHFQNRADVYVAGNMFLYYEEGNPRAAVAPDVFAVVGAPNHDRWSYKLWEEPKAPDFVLEITSRSTRYEDQGPKREVYASLGVGEYWQYDPTGDYLEPPLQGFRLSGRGYEPFPAVALLHGGVTMYSEALGLDLRIEWEAFRFHDPATARNLLDYQEAEQARQGLQARLDEEAAACRDAETRVAELEARLRGEHE